MVVLNRHTDVPTEEELEHMRTEAKKLFPFAKWRGPGSIPEHYHLHEI